MCGPLAAPRPGARALVVAVLLLLLAGCAADGRSGPSARGAGPARATLSGPALPLEEAVSRAADQLLSGLEVLPDGGRRQLAIDPLLDGLAGGQSAATRSARSVIERRVRERHRAFELVAFSTAAIGRSPLVLLGSLTGADAPGEPAGPFEAHRIWLVLADLASGRIVANATVFARADDVDGTPTPFFRDSPAWGRDAGVEAYLRTCGAKAGDPIDPAYLDGILSAALAGDAAAAYDAGRYRDALGLYESAARTPPGDQRVDVLNGIYLANRRLGREAAATEAFGRLVDRGLADGRLAVKFLFASGSTVFWPDPEVSGPYPMWLGQIARRAEAAEAACLELVGHASPTGPAAMNDRLSLLRAEYVRSRLEDEAPGLADRARARGAGSREAIIGTGTDDAADALDRRVEFGPVRC